MNRRPFAQSSDASPAPKGNQPSSERATLVDIDLPPEVRAAFGKSRMPSEPPAATVRRGPKLEMEAAFSAGDFERARDLAEDVLRRDPSDAEAASFAESARLRMRHVFAARLGSLLRVPVRVLDDARLKLAHLTPREQAVVRRVDGVATYEDILEDCGMEELEALRLLCDLLARGVIAPD